MEILNELYSELSHSETIEKIPTDHKLFKDKFKEVWKVTTEVEVGSFQKEISLYVAFEESFPLTIPRIYLSKESSYEIGLIPHVDKDRFVCTFHTDALILDAENPLNIVRTCLRKAKKIIKEGLEGANHGDFKDEIMAYWTDTEESDIIQYLSLLPDFPSETTSLKICKLTPVYNHIKYLLYTNNKDSNTKMILDFVSEKGCNGSESDALFLADYEIDPKSHFPKNNEDILNSLSSESFEHI